MTIARLPIAHRYWLSMLCALTAGALAGFVVARSASAESSPAKAAAPGTARLTVDEWMAMATAAQGRVTDPELRQQLVAALSASPVLRSQVLERYGAEADRRTRALVRDLLTSGPSPDLRPAAVALVRGNEPLARAAGFELLAALPPDAESFALARRGVADEQHAAALAGALMAFEPPGPPTGVELTEVLPRLVELTRHADELVRAHAVQDLARWDKQRDQATAAVERGLRDDAEIVRQASVGAVMIGELHAERLKAALLALAAGAQEDLVTRGAALQALEAFPLTDTEIKTYMASREQLERLASSQQPWNITERKIQ